MIRYERTGEWRPPKKGEWYDTGGQYCLSGPQHCGNDCAYSAWILRRVEEEEPKPPPPARPGTEEVKITGAAGNWRASDSEIIRILEHARDSNEWLSGTYTGAIDEAIRRVRAYERVRRFLRCECYYNRDFGEPSGAKRLSDAVMAILDAEAP